MKKIVILIMIVILLVGCSNNELNFVEVDLEGVSDIIGEPSGPTVEFTAEPVDESEVIGGADEPTTIIITDIDLTDKEIETASVLDFDEIQKKEQINKWIDTMSLKEKVAQLFFVDFRVTGEQVYDFNQVEGFLNQYPVGGFIYFDENIKDKAQVIQLNSALQVYYSKKDLPPVFIGVDEEGGLVSRLSEKALGVTDISIAAQLSQLSISEVYKIAWQLGKEMKTLGFNVNFAPVLDVNSNPNNPVIGKRAFSSDPETAGLYGNAFSQGLEKSVLSFGKHFPGHGDTKGDSHKTGVVSNMTLEEFNAREAIPFAYAIDHGISGIMLGHINIPNLVEDDAIASLNNDLIDLLRHDLAFSGLIITDSLQMKAVTDYYPPERVAIEAYTGGVDLILMPEDFEVSYDHLLEAFSIGTLSTDELDKRLYHILKYKYDLLH